MVNTSPLNILSKNDIRMAQIISSVGNYSIEYHKDFLESIIRSIIYQQLARKAQVQYSRGQFRIIIYVFHVHDKLWKALLKFCVPQLD